MLATGQDWVRRFDLPIDSTLTVRIAFANIATANGASQTSNFVGQSNGFNIFEQGAAYELKTGIDPNGVTPDIEFSFGINGYLQNELWFDPDPVAQQAVVPGDKADARSVVLHEFGHAFGFSGWRNGNTGALPGDFASTFDNQVQAANDTLSFIGANAVALHGGPLAVTAGNDSHLGNDGGDALLLNDLMNGVVFYRGSRCQISAIDLAVMQDIRLPLAPVPEPASWALMALGLLALRPLRRAARR